MASASHAKPSLEAVDPVAFEKLWEQIPSIFDEGRRSGHDVDADLYLTLDTQNLVKRFLIADECDVSKAAERLRATIQWRRDWGILEYYEAGAGRRFYLNDKNPGSEMYFADSLHVDRLGQPYMVGRVHLANSENMHPWNHLRAGVFALERLALQVLRCGGYGSYICDIADVERPGTVSGTGGGGRQLKEKRNPFYRRGAGKEAPDLLLQQFGSLDSGMDVLQAALTIASRFYPEMVSRIIFLRSNILFSMAFKIFRYWVHPRTRNKFNFLGGWADPPLTELLRWYDASELPEEFGGTGWRLDHDSFIQRAVPQYDIPLVPCKRTRRPFVASKWSSGPLEEDGSGMSEDDRGGCMTCFMPRRTKKKQTRVIRSSLPNSVPLLSEKLVAQQDEAPAASIVRFQTWRRYFLLIFILLTLLAPLLPSMLATCRDKLMSA